MVTIISQGTAGDLHWMDYSRPANAPGIDKYAEGVAASAFKAFQTIRPIFRERGKINAEVTGRLSESLGGIRVVKGYHAEEREEKVFSGGVRRLLDNVMRTLTATSIMGLSASVLLGVVGAVVMFVGARQILAGSLTIGGFFTYTLFMGFLIAPIMQIVQIGTQLTEALAGLERTHEILREPAEDHDPRRTRTLPTIEGNVDFRNVSFSYDGKRPVLSNVFFHASPGTVTALVGSSETSSRGRCMDIGRQWGIQRLRCVQLYQRD